MPVSEFGRLLPAAIAHLAVSRKMDRPYPSRWSKLALVCCALAFAVSLMWRSSRFDRSSVAYHVRCLDALRPGPFEWPTSWQNWLSGKTVQWISHGGQSVGQWMTLRQRHQDALIVAGYFETRWVSVLDQGLDARSWKRLYPQSTNTVIGKTRYTITFNGARPHELRITARKSDIDDFERKLHALEADAAKPHAASFH
jgi:hypothetical protein